MYTHEDFIEKLKNINTDIIVLSQYCGIKNKVLCRCVTCEYEWETTADKLINAKHGCPKCGKSIRKTNKEFIEQLYIKNQNITALDEYINDSTRIRFACKICNFIWNTSPSHVLNKTGCPNCSRERNKSILSKSHLDFIKQMKSINSNVEIIGKYINSKTNIDCKCVLCGRIYQMTPSNLLKGEQCACVKQSKGERKLKEIFTKLNINYIEQYKFDNCKYIKQLPFDFYLSDFNICIEYDGEQHFRPVCFDSISSEQAYKNFLFQKERDIVKDDFCKSNNIQLIRIPYFEYNNIEQIITNLINRVASSLVHS